MEKLDLFEKVHEALVEMEEAEVVQLCQKSLELNIPPQETIAEGLISGMAEVGRLYEEEEYFLPEVLVCSDAMNAGIEVLEPHLDKSSLAKPIKVVIGVVEGDTHDIGKNIAKIMAEASGFEVYDLGRNVPLDKFIETAEEVGSDVIAMSTLMTTTMDGMKTVIDILKEKGIRNKYKVLVGGGPISQKFADSIGADLYSKDATEAIRQLKVMFEGGERKCS